MKRPKKIGRKKQVSSSGSAHFYQQLSKTTSPGGKFEGRFPALLGTKNTRSSALKIGSRRIGSACSSQLTVV
jgi:hypothetical protein